MTRRPNFLYHNNGDGTFKRLYWILFGHCGQRKWQRAGAAWEVTLGDYDHDGRLDLFITNFDE